MMQHSIVMSLIIEHCSSNSAYRYPNSVATYHHGTREQVDVLFQRRERYIQDSESHSQPKERRNELKNSSSSDLDLVSTVRTFGYFTDDDAEVVVT